MTYADPDYSQQEKYKPCLVFCAKCKNCMQVKLKLLLMNFHLAKQACMQKFQVQKTLSQTEKSRQLQYRTLPSPTPPS